MGELARDDEIVAVFQTRGDARALEPLVRRYTPMVRSMLYQMVLNEADADDLTQDVFLRVMNGLGQFDGRARFSTWLYRIVMNTAHTFLSRRGRCPVRPSDRLAALPDRNHPQPDQAAMANELDADIAAALASLPATLRAAIVLTAIHKLDGREVAKIERCSAAAVYWRVHKARKILRERLGQYLT